MVMQQRRYLGKHKNINKTEEKIMSAIKGTQTTISEVGNSRPIDNSAHQITNAKTILYQDALLSLITSSLDQVSISNLRTVNKTIRDNLTFEFMVKCVTKEIIGDLEKGDALLHAFKLRKFKFEKQDIEIILNHIQHIESPNVKIKVLSTLLKYITILDDDETKESCVNNIINFTIDILNYQVHRNPPKDSNLSQIDVFNALSDNENIQLSIDYFLTLLNSCIPSLNLTLILPHLLLKIGNTQMPIDHINRVVDAVLDIVNTNKNIEVKKNALSSLCRNIQIPPDRIDDILNIISTPNCKYIKLLIMEVLCENEKILFTDNHVITMLNLCRLPQIHLLIEERSCELELHCSCYSLARLRAITQALIGRDENYVLSPQFISLYL